jgi:hypothetical protein
LEALLVAGLAGGEEGDVRAEVFEDDGDGACTA